MKMKNMALSKSKQEQMVAESPKIDGPRYPYGLNVSLDNEVIDKLEMKELPSANDEVLIIAKAKVTSVSINEQSDNTKNKRIELQITDLCIEGQEDEIDIKKALYEKS